MEERRALQQVTLGHLIQANSKGAAPGELHRDLLAIPQRPSDGKTAKMLTGILK